MARANLTLFLLFIGATAALGEWRVLDAGQQPTASAAVTHWRVQLEENGTGQSVRLHLAVFDSKKATLRIFDQPSEPRAKLAAIMQKNDCVAGVNGGYFHPDYGAVGLLLSSGKTIAPMQKAKLLSGTVAVSNDRVQLLRRAELQRRQTWREARQAGPFLVDNGKPVAGLNDTRSARRTFIAAGGRGMMAVGSSSALTLAQLAQVLASKGAAEGLEILRALNLDGGSSTGFWCTSANGAPVSIQEYKTVRDVIGVVEK